jgi:hypothetical protein
MRHATMHSLSKLLSRTIDHLPPVLVRGYQYTPKSCCLYEIAVPQIHSRYCWLVVPASSSAAGKEALRCHQHDMHLDSKKRTTHCWVSKIVTLMSTPRESSKRTVARRHSFILADKSLRPAHPTQTYIPCQMPCPNSLLIIKHTRQLATKHSISAPDNQNKHNNRHHAPYPNCRFARHLGCERRRKPDYDRCK